MKITIYDWSTKPRKLPSTRRAVPDTRLAEINQVAATAGTTPSWTP